MQQVSLFDIDLKFKKGNSLEDFKDEAKDKLDKLEWHSPEKQTFFYSEPGNKKLSLLTLDLKGIRRINKKKKFEFVLLRHWHYSGLEECIDDEVKAKTIEDLEKCFENEISLFKSDLYLPEDVLFDGRRYCWKFEKREDGTIEFIEKWLPEVN